MILRDLVYLKYWTLNLNQLMSTLKYYSLRRSTIRAEEKQV